MPLYEYECDRGHRFERIVKFSDPPIDACPECGAAVHKLMSSPAFQFKGTGWYITDYARKGADGKESTDAKDAKPAESKGTETKEAKTEKPAAETTTAKKAETTSTTSTKSD